MKRFKEWCVIRNRLLELIDKAQRKYYDDISTKRHNEYIADYLIENGVIIPSNNFKDRFFVYKNEDSLYYIGDNLNINAKQYRFPLRKFAEEVAEIFNKGAEARAGWYYDRYILGRNKSILNRSEWIIANIHEFR